jgi:hypothetical protein
MESLFEPRNVPYKVLPGSAGDKCGRELSRKARDWDLSA